MTTKSTKKNAVIETRVIRDKTTDWLKYEFTEDEITELSKDMAKNTIMAKNLEEKKKAIASDLKGQIDQAVLAMNEAAKHIQEGHEYRNVDCMKELDFDTGMCVITRTDTGEVVNTRKMNSGEKQMTITGITAEEDQEAKDKKF